MYPLLAYISFLMSFKSQDESPFKSQDESRFFEAFGYFPDELLIQVEVALTQLLEAGVYPRLKLLRIVLL